MAAVPWQALAAQLSPLTLLTEQLHKLAYRTFPLAILSLSSSESLVSETSWLMGRRDKRTRKGKVFKGSSGNVSHVGSPDGQKCLLAGTTKEAAAAFLAVAAGATASSACTEAYTNPIPCQESRF